VNVDVMVFSFIVRQDSDGTASAFYRAFARERVESVPYFKCLFRQHNTVAGNMVSAIYRLGGSDVVSAFL
jgi:hypothetical protein